MFQPLRVTRPDDLERFCAPAGVPTVRPEVLDRQHPDALWLLTDTGDNLAARCALWWRDTPPLRGERLGLIGHYHARDQPAGFAMLSLACQQLAAQGCSLIVGPMDGNTWQRYRLLTERGTEPIFFLEPDNPDAWPGHFTAAGFTPLAQYYSALNSDLSATVPPADESRQRLEQTGIAIRPLRLDSFEDELRRIHTLSLESFADNFLYTPISEADFLQQYAAIGPYVRPELVLLAERQEQLIGFLFLIPDLNQATTPAGAAAKTAAIDTVIFKTMAVHPGHRGMGLGSLLMARGHEISRQLGFRRGIHALMYEKNLSRRISSHTARMIRRYTLFARPSG
jgi:GNAT superfamily N-acetyltransferase